MPAGWTRVSVGLGSPCLSDGEAGVTLVVFLAICCAEPMDSYDVWFALLLGDGEAR